MRAVSHSSFSVVPARLVREWIGLHGDELLANWQRAQAMEPLVAIDPLQVA